MDAVQNKPITIKLKSNEYINNQGYKVLYTKASDSVENNPIYVGKTPSKIVTYNNVLLFPTLGYIENYGHTTYLIISPITSQVLNIAVSVTGMGDIVTCGKDKDNDKDIYLSADLPEVLGEHYDTHTFTITIDPDIKDDFIW